MGMNLGVGEKEEGGVGGATRRIKRGMMGRNRQIFMNMQHDPSCPLCILAEVPFSFTRFMLVTLYSTLCFCFL